jgi:hypothetical protein
MVGMVCCPWLQDQPIEHESMLERHFIMAALSIPGLRHIQHQPFKLHLDVPTQINAGASTSASAGTAEESDPSTYVPDFLLRFECGHAAIVEVKPKVFLKKSSPKLRAAAAELRARRHSFFVFSDEDLDRLGGSVHAVLSRRSSRLAPETRRIRAALEEIERQPKGTTAAHLCSVADVTLNDVAWLIARGRAWAKTPFHLTPQSRIHPLSSTEVRNAALRVGDWLGIAPW